ncbi:MAG: pteridine reductase [Gammaproteobacteria bacterium]
MLKDDTSKVVLITGGAKRIGAAIVHAFHTAGWRVVIHYHSAATEAQLLCAQLNGIKAHSVYTIQLDLTDHANYAKLISQTVNVWGRLDALINNASNFLPSYIGSITADHWQHIFSVNVHAPFFLSQEAFSYLREYNGSIVNITDTHADGRPIKDYAVYSMSKAALLMQTQALARELAPYVRVNAVAPGISMWDNHMNAGSSLTVLQEEILERTPLKRSANENEVAKAVIYLVSDASYTTGSTIYVDGGRCVYN